MLRNALAIWKKNLKSQSSRWSRKSTRSQRLPAVEVLEDRSLLSSINGVVFEDANGNRSQDAGEGGLAGVTVYLDANGNRMLDSGEDSTTSDGDGSYNFANLTAGSYQVRQIVPTDFRQTTPTGANRLFGTTFLGTASVVELDPITGNPLNSFPLPNVTRPPSFTQGLAFDGQSLFYLENDSQTLCELDPNDGTIRNSYSLRSELANRNIGGLTALDGKIYMLDITSNAQRAILGFDPARGQITSTVGIGNAFNYGGGLGAVSDEGLVVAATDSIMNFYNPETGVIVDRALLSNSSLPPSGIAVLGDEIYITFGSTFTQVLDRDGNLLRTLDALGESAGLAGGPGSDGAHRVTVDGIQDVVGLDFGNQSTTASLSGVKFEDINGNGVRDSGEPGIAGVTIYLDQNGNRQLDTGERSTLTAADGTYTIGSLAAGDYTVREIVPDGFVQTTQGNDPGIYYGAAYIIGSNGQMNYVEIDPLTGSVNRIGNPLPDRMHGLVRTNSGDVYGLNGFNSDRIYRIDPQTGTATVVGFTGYEMTFGLAYDPLTDTILGVGKPIATDQTNYLLVVDRTDGSVTQVGSGYVGLTATSGLAFDTDTRRVIAFDNQDDEFVAFDLEGTAIQIADLFNMSTASLTYTPQGLIFGGLGTGTDGQGNILRETIREVNLQTGVRTTILNLSEAAPMESLDWANDPSQYRYLLADGQAVTGVDFGNRRGSGAIRGSVFEDLDEDGIRDVGEPGLEGTTVYLDLNSNGALDSGDITSITSSSGLFEFTNLTPSTYRVRQVPPIGYEQTSPSSLGFDVIVADGQVIEGLEFGAALANRPPVADAGGDYTIDEGSGLSLDASQSSDPDNDPLTFTWDLDNDGVFDDANGALINLDWGQLLSLGINDDGIYPLSVQVSDGEFTDTDNVFLAVRTAAPTNLNLSVNPGTIEEGASTTLTGTFDDPGMADTHVVEISWGDGSSSTISLTGDERVFSASHQYADDGDYTVSAIITDNDGRKAFSGDNIVDTVVMDFDQFLHTDNGRTFDTVTEEGFFLDYPDHQFARFQVFGANHGAFADSPALSTQFQGQTIELTRSGSGTFNVVSIDLSELSPNLTAHSPATVTFTGTRPDGVTVEDTFTTTEDGVFGFETFFFHDGFKNLSSLTWSSGLSADKSIHQFDNIVLETPAIGTPAPVVTVTNVAPSSLALTLNPVAISENGSTILSGTFNDVGTLDTHTVVIQWGEGSSDTIDLTNGERTFTIGHQYLDDNAADLYTITAIVTDDDGESDEESINMSVTNVGPSNLALTLNPVAISENGSTTLSGTFNDVGTLDTHTVVIQWGDGSSDTIDLTNGERSFSIGHQYLDDNAADLYTITATVTDDDGDSDEESINMSVTNVGPSSLALTLNPGAVSESGSTALSGTFNDVGTLDTHTVVIQWGDGSSDTIDLTNGERSFSIGHQYLDDNAADLYTITVTVTDDDGDTDEESINASVANIAPSDLALTLNPVAISENGSTTLSGTFNDVGTLDTHMVVIQWGDGSSDTIDLTNGERTFTIGHQYLDDNAADLYTITTTVTDDDGESDEESINVSVSNIAPVVTLANVSSNNLNVSIVAEFFDVGTLDTHSAVIDWGDGTSSNGMIAEEAITGTHQYDRSGTFTIVVTVTDDDGDRGLRTIDVSVNAELETGATLEDGILKIVGTNQDDSVSIKRHGRRGIRVKSNFLPRRGATFDARLVHSIEVRLLDGDDRLKVDKRIGQPLLVLGGAGDDVIRGGGGRSVIIGGLGADRLIGGSKQDLLITGTTDFDDNPLALRRILAEWSSGHSLRTRVQNLTSGGGANGNHTLGLGTEGTVHNDSDVDRVYGSRGIDWHFHDRNLDCIRGRVRDDIFSDDLGDLLDN